MERGFKTRCEEMSRSLRTELGLGPATPLPVEQLASYLGVYLWSVEDLGLAPADVAQLVNNDPESWSAITVSAAGKDAIILNPHHRRGRYSSDVMHELAHLLLGHEPSTMFFAGQENLALRGFNQDAEEEANWLAGALLLPRDALVRLRTKNSSKEEEGACDEFGVSRQMMEFRMRVTGVNRQFSQRTKTASN